MNMMKKPFEMKLTPPQILVSGFAIIILFGGILLSLPFSTRTGLGTPFLDALFTATSAVCVTGLVVVDTGTHYSLFGQIVILMLIQMGGLGFMTMATLVALAIKKRITLKERLILQEAMNQSSIEGIVRLIKKVLAYALAIQLIGMIVFTIRWSFDMPFRQAFYFGTFHAISFFNNAGFDLFGLYSGKFTSIMSYVDDPIINLTSMFLIIFGGIGFIVISDMLGFRTRRSLSLHSKVVLSMSGFLIVFGAIVIFIFEFTNEKTLGSLDWTGKIWGALFQSVTPRTAGANTLDIAGLRQATQFFIIILMFIGASPGSTGGGIKTTTFTILIGSVIAMIRGKHDIVLFRYRLAQDRIFKAITLTLIALFLVLFTTMVLTTTEDRNFLMILFEVTSAFGTVGLSMGLTPQLSEIGRIMIILMMFAGRLGPVTLAYSLRPKAEKELYRHPEGKITIG
ncbi:TrkH family potassium uptake protein [Paenibacillus sp. Soil522]|uniref:TrkH family potassium uptake protein n=1 Tax=Paenibacillus sp. Soil522 TaxID=1736388 RepID=UPI0006F58346|nr:TrkH family potassium uptake protein [Paenibacillus sp. Soil522]KRE29673.1 ATP synthase subunit J [Paenibacillus sp. Soil522]